MVIHYKKESVRRPAGRFFVTGVLAALLLTGCRQAGPVQLVGEAQGTYYSVQYFDAQQRNLQPQIDSLLDDFDLTASLWVDSSLLRRVNANLTTEVSPRFADLLQKSLEVNRYSEGAFDCRIGRIVQVWGFSFKERSEPDSAMLDSLLHAARGKVSVGSDGHTLVKEHAATELDFNAIAQGYASDLLAHYLDSLGIHNYLIDIGGEVIARGEKPGGNPWTVGIERPAEDRYSAPEVQAAIALRDAAVVTSGSYRKYYEKDGVRYSHTIDPSTGRPVEHSLLSVSVIEKECWLADAMATAYMVMGLERAKQFIATHPEGPGTSAVFFIYDDGGTMKEYATPAFQKMIKKNQ